MSENKGIVASAVANAMQVKEIPARTGGIRESTKELLNFMNTAKTGVHKIPTESNKYAGMVAGQLKKLSEKFDVKRVLSVVTRGQDVYIELAPKQ